MGDVLLLDDDDELREALADLIRFTTGRSCVAVGSLAELRLQRGRALDCELALIDVNLGAGRPSGHEACAWLRAQRFGGRIVFLTGRGAVDADELRALFSERRDAA
jgi:DNA-binding NarL/FixJ family response regulator